MGGSETTPLLRRSRLLCVTQLWASVALIQNQMICVSVCSVNIISSYWCTNLYVQSKSKMFLKSDINVHEGCYVAFIKKDRKYWKSVICHKTSRMNLCRTLLSSRKPRYCRWLSTIWSLYMQKVNCTLKKLALFKSQTVLKGYLFMLTVMEA